MTEVFFYESAEDSLLKFAVILARHQEKWVLCRHRQRRTWEIPGGHREPGEAILDTARRELREETGAVDFFLSPVCVYSVRKGREETFGMLYAAQIHSFEPLHSEIEEILLTEDLDVEWTYPLIQPQLIREAQRRDFCREKRLLITGFSPFGGQSLNPSWLAVEQLPDRVGKYAVTKLPIPTVFGKAAEEVLAQGAALAPDVILCTGLAGGRDAVTPERIAVNIRDARIPDNAGNQPRGDRIVPEGPAAYFATVPVEAMRDAIQAQGIPAAVSNTAGAYVCNDVLYTLLHHYAGTDTKIGFIHVPYLPQQGSPSLPLERTVQALKAAIEAL